MSTGNICRPLGGVGPGARRFGRRGTQSGHGLAASRRGRTLAQAGNGGVQAHSGIPAWQRGDASQSVSTFS
jgi:hypothetical protein